MKRPEAADRFVFTGLSCFVDAVTAVAVCLESSFDQKMAVGLIELVGEEKCRRCVAFVKCPQFLNQAFWNRNGALLAILRLPIPLWFGGDAHDLLFEFDIVPSR